MARYDWERGYDRGFRMRRGRPDDASAFGSWGDAWGSAPSAGFRGRGVGLYRDWGTPWESGRSGGYGRDIYGGDYPGYGGVPGGRERGMYYGGGGERGYGYDFGGGYRRGYDAGYARGPFMPEDAYRRHPEYNRPQRHLHDRWPDRGHRVPGGELDDEEVTHAVRQSLYQDNWIDAERIGVEVNGGVVTLTGEVDDYLEARYAWDDVWDTEGVRGVINNLHVRVDEPAGEHDQMVQSTGRGRAATENKGGQG